MRAAADSATMGDLGPLRVRARTSEDLDACVALTRELRESDGYPAFMATEDFERFLVPTNILGAWVALDDLGILGHVTTRTSSAPAATELATARLGIAPSALGFVSRLMVAPRARRRGIARQLLSTAALDLASRGLVAVLDVLTRDVAAIALYEHEGWVRLGTTSFTSRSGTRFDEVVFLAPGQDLAPPP